MFAGLRGEAYLFGLCPIIAQTLLHLRPHRRRFLLPVTNESVILEKHFFFNECRFSDGRRFNDVDFFRHRQSQWSIRAASQEVQPRYSIFIINIIFSFFTHLCYDVVMSRSFTNPLGDKVRRRQVSLKKENIPISDSLQQKLERSAGSARCTSPLVARRDSPFTKTA